MEEEQKVCSFNKLSKDAVFLIGDSHLEVLSEDLLNRIKQKKMNYISMNRGSCIYLPNFKKVYKKNNEEVHNCTLESKKIIDLHRFLLDFEAILASKTLKKSMKNRSKIDQQNK